MPSSTSGSVLSSGATAQPNFSDDESILKVVNKTLFQGKQQNSTVRFEDVEKVFGELIRLEEGVSRTIRQVNRKANNVQNHLGILANEVNAGFQTFTDEISKVAGKVKTLENLTLANKNIQQAMAITQPPVPHLPVPPPVQQLVHQARQTLNQSQESSSSDDEDDDQQRNALSFQSVNMITDAYPMALEGYKDDCVVTFDRWAKRFREYMDAFGRKLDEKDKLARLVIYLDGVPKRILEKMDPNRKATIDLALANLRTDLDSPQSKGLSKQALIACRQMDSEPVKDFLNRFIPLAEASVSDVKDDSQKEAQLRELFLERLRPNIALVMKMLDMSRGKKFEQLCWEAREVEIMLSAQAGGLPFVPQFASVQAMDNQNFQSSSLTPPGNFRTLAPTQQNRYPPRHNNWRNQPRQSNRNESRNRGRQSRDRDMGHGPTNDRRWNNRPYCNYCRRVGHVANACRIRLRDYQDEQRGSYGNTRLQPQRRTPATGANAIQHDRSIELLNEIASGLRNLSLDMNQHKSLNDVNVVENSSRATALPNNSEIEYEVNCPASGRSSPWEGVRMMPRITPLLPFIVFLIVIILDLNGAKAAPPSLPLICQTDIQPTIWGLPKQVQCPLPAEVATHVPLMQTRELFVINDFEHNTQAWACRKIKKKARKFTTLSGVPVVEPLDPELLEMSVDECKRMVEHKTCDFGILTERDGLWGTDHTLDLTPRLWLLGSFSWSDTESEDCFAFKTQVFHHFGEETIRTPLGTTSHCRYLFGNCTLNDKSILVWTPEKQLYCRYTSIGKFKGRYVSNTWLSDDAQYGLHFKTKTPKVSDCNKTLTVSEQGFATRIIVSKRKRTKRSYGSVEHLGLATSPEMNAKLTYLDDEWVDSLMYAIRHSFKTQCDFFSAMTKMLTNTHLIDPTSLARSLFNNTKVYAVRAGSSLLKIWPCVQLKKGEFRFKPTRLDNKCFDKLPIEFVTQSENRLAFLDPFTMIIVPDSAKVACAQHRKIVVQIEGQPLEVDQVTGETKILKVKDFDIEPRLPGIFEIERHSFHQMALFNVSDLNTHAFLSGMVKVSELTYRIDEQHKKVKVTVSDQWRELTDELERKVVGDYKLTWLCVLSLVSSVLLIDFLLRWLPILLETYTGPGWLGRMIFGTKKSRRSRDTGNLTVDELPNSSATVEEIPLQSIPGNPMNWPPSVSSFQTMFSSSDPATASAETTTNVVNKSPRKRLRPSSVLQIGTSTTTLILLLIIALVAIPVNAEQASESDLKAGTGIFLTFSDLLALLGIVVSLGAMAGFIACHMSALSKSRSFWATASSNHSIMEEIVANHTMTPRLTATVRSLINNRPVSCLADTGASVSLAPMSLANELKCKIFPTNHTVRSASGHWINITAAAMVHIEIAGQKIFGEIKLIQDEVMTDRKDYQVILGCDLMAKLPPITFDFVQGLISISGKSVTMGERGDLLYSNVKVVARHHVDIQPGSYSMLTGKLDSQIQLDQVVTHSLDGRLSKMHVGMISTVAKPVEGCIKMILTNPTDAPINICAGMHVALANELKQSADGPWLEEQSQGKEANVNPEITTNDPSFKINFAKSSATGENLNKLKKLCAEFVDVFSKSQYDLGSCLVGEHDIITTTEDPITAKPRRTPFRFREEVRDHMQKWIKAGVMVNSDTPWISNIVLVQKKDGGLRPCIDFRKLNEITVPDHFPLPRLEVVLEKIGNCHWYTSLDLSSGYLQIRLTERASRKCGIITEDDVYQMTHMPFGLRNATSAFARVMAHVLSGLEDSVIAYVDDFLIYSKSPDFDLHLLALRRVFTRLRQFNLKVSPKKCVMASSKMEFLGFIINKDGYTPSLGKVEIIKDIPAPTSLKEVRRFVGMASFFRKHIPGFSTITEPLTKLTKKDMPFSWDVEQHEAFNQIKKLLSEDPILRFPDYSKPFHIFTDASTVGQGGALMQKEQDNSAFHAVAYCSRTLSEAERKWPPVQVELGAIIFALRQFRPFIYMGNVELHTDHKPLAYLLQKAEAHPNLARWLIELQNYSIKIVHVAGKQNMLADALSRAAHECRSEEEIKNLRELEDIAEFPACLSLTLDSRLVVDECVDSLTLRAADGNSYSVDLRLEQKADQEATAFIKFIEKGEISGSISEAEKEQFSVIASKLIMDSGILFHKEGEMRPRIFVPVSLRPLIFDSFHTSPLGGGHMDLKKTLRKCRKYFWPRMHADIVNWVRSCITCQLRHSPTPAYRAEMKLPKVNTLFAKVGLDLAGPFPITKKGNRHILCIICWFTRFVIAVPVPDAKAVTLVKAFLSNCYLKFGGCTELITDNATAFTSEFFREFCSMLYISKRYATPHWSQGNATTERSFRTFHNIMSKYVSSDQPDFDEHLDMATFCYNTAIHQSTGESPFFLMYGRDPIFCIDQILDPKSSRSSLVSDLSEFKQKLVNSLRTAWEAAAGESKQAQQRAKAQYDKLIRCLEIKVGDRVLLRNYAGKVGTSKKFHLPWKGVFRVIKIEDVMVTIVSCNAPQANPKVVHINQLKKCVEILGPACTAPNVSDEEKLSLEKADAIEVFDMPGFNHLNSDNPNKSETDPNTEST